MSGVLERPAMTVLVACVLSNACVPEGPATQDAGTPTPRPAASPVVTRTGPIADAAVAPDDAGPILASTFEDGFERAEPGPDWNVLSPKWRITAGKLCVRGARNHGAWLRRRLPTNARIEFDAFAETPEGDLKIEVWGDGVSGATAASYTNATSYLAILGGWKNTKHVLARLDEHGADRQEMDVDATSDDERARPVAPGQPYHFKIERADGKTLDWSVNGARIFRLVDAEPLAGPGHEHLAFNDWDAPVCFDNVKVTPL